MYTIDDDRPYGSYFVVVIFQSYFVMLKVFAIIILVVVWLKHHLDALFSWFKFVLVLPIWPLLCDVTISCHIACTTWSPANVFAWILCSSNVFPMRGFLKYDLVHPSCKICTSSLGYYVTFLAMENLYVLNRIVSTWFSVFW